MKLKSYATCALLSLFPLASQAVEVGTYQGVKLDLGLQINRALMYADDGITNETFFVDNDNSSTRFSLKAQSNLDDKISVGALFEAEYQSNPSNLVDMETKTTASPTLDERKMEAWISSKEYGRLTIGQGSGAADGNMERQLSGTAIINWPNPTLVGGALKFGGTGPTIKSTMSNLDFEGRYDRLRYDTPKFGPISLAVSQGTNKGNDAARGTGAGRALIEGVYKTADKNGTPNVYWTTQHFNETARKLYDRIGDLTPFIKYQRG